MDKPSSTASIQLAPSNVVLYGTEVTMASALDAAMERVLKQEMKLILMSDIAQGIDFHLDNIHVDSSAFRLVALALEPKQGGKKGISVAFGGLAAGQGARWEPDRRGQGGTFRFPREMYPLFGADRMNVIHESVHCWLDAIHGIVFTLGGRRATPLMLSEEAAAYVSESLFFLADNPPEILFNFTKGTSTQFNQSLPNFGPILDAAFSVALHIHGGSPGQDVSSDASMASLKSSILNSPTYLHIRRDPKGSYSHPGL